MSRIYKAKKPGVFYETSFSLRQTSADGTLSFINDETGADHVLWPENYSAIVDVKIIGRSFDADTSTGVAFFAVDNVYICLDASDYLNPVDGTAITKLGDEGADGGDIDTPTWGIGGTPHAWGFKVGNTNSLDTVWKATVSGILLTDGVALTR